MNMCHGLAGEQTWEGCCVESGGNPDTVNTGLTGRDAVKDYRTLSWWWFWGWETSACLINKSEMKWAHKKCLQRQTLTKTLKVIRRTVSFKMSESDLFVELVGNCARLPIGPRGDMCHCLTTTLRLTKEVFLLPYPKGFWLVSSSFDHLKKKKTQIGAFTDGLARILTWNLSYQAVCDVTCSAILMLNSFLRVFCLVCGSSILSMI